MPPLKPLAIVNIFSGLYSVSNTDNKPITLLKDWLVSRQCTTT